MIRGTDSQFVFNLPCECSNLASVKIAFWQPGNKGVYGCCPLPRIKTMDNCVLSGKQIYVILEKNETLEFTDKRKAYSQIICETIGGTTFAGKQEMITVHPVRDEIYIEPSIESLNGGSVLPETGDEIIVDGGSIGPIDDGISENQDESVTVTYDSGTNY